jgi:glycogen operon protein
MTITAQRELHDYISEISEHSDVRTGSPLPLGTQENRLVRGICAEIRWLVSQDGSPNWSDPKERQFACLVHEDERRALYLMFNASADGVDFGVSPLLPGVQWHPAVDTSRQGSQELSPAAEEPLWEGLRTYHLSPRSSAILLARGTEAK